MVNGSSAAHAAGSDLIDWQRKLQNLEKQQTDAINEHFDGKADSAMKSGNASVRHKVQY